MTTPARPTTDRELAALRTALAGELVVAGEPGFDQAHAPAVARFRGVRPRAVVRCAVPEDVSEALAVARRLRLPVAVRSGGHCFAGRSSTTGILVDVSPMRTVAVDGSEAVVGAGTRLGTLYDALAPHGRTLPAGCGPTVGIAGLTLGGGFGLLGRVHGLTCDHLLAAEVVLPDGRTAGCDRRRHPHLFWALQGGGGAGCVVTALRFRLVAAPPATVFQLAWAPTDAARVVAAWPGWAPTAPAEISATLRLVAPADPATPAEVRLVGAVLGGGATALLDGLVLRAGVEPVSAALTELPYRDAKAALAGLGGHTAQVPGIRCSRSEFFRRAFPRDAAAALVRTVVDERVAGHHHEVALIPWGGAYNRVHPGATAFAHRREAFLVENTIHTAVDTAATARRRLARSWSTVQPWGSGRTYPNFPDPDRPPQPRAEHGRNHDRLRRVRAAYAPP